MLDTVHKFNAKDGSFEKEYSRFFDVDESGNVNATGGVTLNIYDYTAKKLGVHL